MSRYIDANAFDERVRISVGLVEEELTDDYKDGVRCTLEMLKTEPTADVVERKRGKWIEDKEQNHIELTFHCSECGCEAWGIEETTNYCHECGAEMVILFQNF